MDEAITKSWRFQAAQSPGVLVNHKKKTIIKWWSTDVNRCQQGCSHVWWLKKALSSTFGKRGGAEKPQPNNLLFTRRGKSFILVVEAEIAQSLPWMVQLHWSLPVPIADYSPPAGCWSSAAGALDSAGFLKMRGRSITTPLGKPSIPSVSRSQQRSKRDPPIPLAVVTNTKAKPGNAKTEKHGVKLKQKQKYNYCRVVWKHVKATAQEQHANSAGSTTPHHARMSSNAMHCGGKGLEHLPSVRLEARSTPEQLNNLNQPGPTDIFSVIVNLLQIQRPRQATWQLSKYSSTPLALGCNW